MSNRLFILIAPLLALSSSLRSEEAAAPPVLEIERIGTAQALLTLYFNPPPGGSIEIHLARGENSAQAFACTLPCRVRLADLNAWRIRHTLRLPGQEPRHAAWRKLLKE